MIVVKVSNFNLKSEDFAVMYSWGKEYMLDTLHKFMPYFGDTDKDTQLMAYLLKTINALPKKYEGIWEFEI
jgi:hypothetical protein